MAILEGSSNADRRRKRAPTKTIEAMAARTLGGEVVRFAPAAIDQPAHAFTRAVQRRG